MASKEGRGSLAATSRRQGLPTAVPTRPDGASAPADVAGLQCYVADTQGGHLVACLLLFSGIAGGVEELLCGMKGPWFELARCLLMHVVTAEAA